jgi:hypothetical protein
MDTERGLDSPVASPADGWRKGFLLLGFLAAAGLFGYALTYLVGMPQVHSDGFIPTSVNTNATWPSAFATVQSSFIVLYAFALLPVVVMFTVKSHAASPYAIIGAGSLLVLTLVLELVNNLPVLVAGSFAGRFAHPDPETLLYLLQMESVRYLALDLVGFSGAYFAFFVYAVVFRRTRRVLWWTILASIGLFLANVPFLWAVPNMAVILMALSVIALAPAPVILSRMSTAAD